LGEDADQETIKKLKQQITEETELIKQGYSDKKVARLNDIAEQKLMQRKQQRKLRQQEINLGQQIKSQRMRLPQLLK
jgi:hypothetical protein